MPYRNEIYDGSFRLGESGPNLNVLGQSALQNAVNQTVMSDDDLIAKIKRLTIELNGCVAVAWKRDIKLTVNTIGSEITIERTLIIV